jgi:hypothetical protein
VVAAAVSGTLAAIDSFRAWRPGVYALSGYRSFALSLDEARLSMRPNTLLKATHTSGWRCERRRGDLRDRVALCDLGGDCRTQRYWPFYVETARTSNVLRRDGGASSTLSGSSLAIRRPFPCSAICPLPFALEPSHALEEAQRPEFESLSLRHPAPHKTAIEFGVTNTFKIGESRIARPNIILPQ